MAEDGVAPDDELIRAIAASGVVVSTTLGIAPGDHPPPPPRIAAALPKLFELARTMVAAGITFTVGSDAGIGPPKPHDVLPYGAVALAGMGLGPRGALTAVTSTAARACRVADRKGALRPGHDADLLVVRGDPLTDIEALHRVVAVYRAGVRVADSRTSPPAPSPAAILAKLTAAETMPS
jgi:Imidazolonepropionase and related amidohydrolases